MTKRRGEAKPWVHLQPEHLFDQTNGAVDFDVEHDHTAGMTPEERIANAGAIGGIAQAMGNGF